jgi:hypothetical protein
MMAGGVDQVVESLHNKHGALSSNLSAAKTKEKERAANEIQGKWEGRGRMRRAEKQMGRRMEESEEEKP